jgi:hypothetical protein
MDQQFKIFRQNFGYNQIPFSPFPFPDLAKLVFLLLRPLLPPPSISKHIFYFRRKGLIVIVQRSLRCSMPAGDSGQPVSGCHSYKTLFLRHKIS